MAAHDLGVHAVDFLFARRASSTGSGVEYAIRWKGYDTTHDCFQDQATIDTASINEFEASWKAPWGRGAKYAVDILEARRSDDAEQSLVSWKGFAWKDKWMSTSELEAPSVPPNKKQKAAAQADMLPVPDAGKYAEVPAPQHKPVDVDLGVHAVDFLFARRASSTGSGVEYAIRWKGYDTTHDCFQDQATIDTASINEFEASWKAPWGRGAKYAVDILEARRSDDAEQSLVSWKGFAWKDKWMSTLELEAPSGPLAEKRRKAAAQARRAVDQAKRTLPVSGDSVEVFSARAGWRLGVVEDTSTWATLVRFNTGEAMQHVFLPLDFESGDVRWPAEQTSHLEGRRVLVPLEVFGQDEDERYAGIIKTVNRGSSVVYFPVDGKEVKFSASLASEWLVDAEDAHVVAEWELKVPLLPPAGWQGEVLFCSLPLQEGTLYQANQRLLKTYCRLSERMAGVEIRRVDANHPLSGSRHDHGLYATLAFKRGACLGSYAGVIRNASKPRAPQNSEGAYDIHLDTSCLPCYSGDIVLDAKEVGNESRFINDYRGIAAARNVRFETVANARKGIWVDVIVTRPIAAGEEILVDYDDGTTPEPEVHPAPEPPRPQSSHAPQPKASAKSRSRWEAGSSGGWLCVFCNNENDGDVEVCEFYGKDGRPCNSLRSTGLAGPRFA